MKKQKLMKLLPLVLLLVLVIALAASGVMAALVDSTAVLENKFEASRISMELKDQYAVSNTGSTACLARVKLIVNWVDEDGNVLAEAPQNASFSWTDGVGWTHLGKSSDPSDGYWYYNQPIPAYYESTPVISRVQAQSGKVEIRILAEVVQAAPAEAAASLWPEAAYQKGSWTAR